VIEVWAVVAAVAGAAFGLGADRLAARWPEREPDTPRRGLDWRTGVVVVAGGAVAAGLVLRWEDPRDVAVLGIWCAALLVLLATDLDQKLLPEPITLPLIGYSGVVLLLGWSPILAGDERALLSGLAAAIGTPIFLAVTDFLLKGALGFGDLVLSVGIGLMAGVMAFFTGFLVASVGVSVLLLVLIGLRRLTLKTAIPFGPILIGAAFVAALAP
jgi:leader peptidase (prepilin peptidase) / N-methyltransferase